jgi:hypothetical protein
MRAMKAICVALTAVILLAVGCRRLDEAQVPGLYAADYEGGSDTLELLADGTYKHKVGLETGAMVLTGTWKTDTLSGEKLGLSFEAFQFRRNSQTLKPSGVWHVEVERVGAAGDLALCFDPDLEKCFVRQ